MVKISRRGFLGGTATLFGISSLQGAGYLEDHPRLRVGIMSDVHITTPESTALMRNTFRYFRDRKVDAVLIAGDLADWGLKSGLQYIADAWFDIFPNNKAPDGHPVEKLFCTGNHDYSGWRYGDMTLDMHVQGYSEKERLVKLGMKKCWEEVFQEEWQPVRRKTVKGYDFISAEWEYANLGIADQWLEKNGKALDPHRPFFLFNHIPLAGTTSCSPNPNSRQNIKALWKYANAVSLTGHTHRTLNDERSIWQGAFTAISIPSSSYTSSPHGSENGESSRNGSSRLAMRDVPSRENFERAQGFVLSVFDDRMIFERRDFKKEVEAGKPWIVPLPVRSQKPSVFEVRKPNIPIPQFPSGAQVKTYTSNLETRNYCWTIMMMLEFPAATAKGGRVFDYEVRVEMEDGSVPVKKRYLSPAYYELESEEPKIVKFPFDAMHLPERGRYRLAVYPRNSFGVCGKPIQSIVRESVPGKTSCPSA